MSYNMLHQNQMVAEANHLVWCQPEIRQALVESGPLDLINRLWLNSVLTKVM